MRQIAKATGAQIALTLNNIEGEDSFDPSYLGECGEVAQEWISDRELIYFRKTKNTATSSIILRGPNDYTLDEMERYVRPPQCVPTLSIWSDHPERSAVHDSLCIVKRTLESNKVVPGGGAVEAALSIYLENFATTLGSCKTFGQSLD